MVKPRYIRSDKMSTNLKRYRIRIGCHASPGCLAAFEGVVVHNLPTGQATGTAFGSLLPKQLQLTSEGAYGGPLPLRMQDLIQAWLL